MLRPHHPSSRRSAALGPASFRVPAGPAALRLLVTGVLVMISAGLSPLAAQDIASAGLVPPDPSLRAPACATAEHRSFDFWLGEWDVFTPDGAQAGRNRIEWTMGGCVLHEAYEGQGGYMGESFNTFDASRGVWHQTWVDNGGLLLVLEGAFDDGAMRLEGRTVGPEGGETLNRITWSVLDTSGDRVRQHWELSTDGGATWVTGFDGEYRRRR